MSRKQIGFGILVALIVALFAVLISVFQLNAEVCFTLFALAAPIYLVGRLVESKRLELAGLGSAIVAFGMSGWMDEFDTILDVLTFGQIVTAVLLGLAVAAGIYLAMRKLGYRYFADDDDFSYSAYLDDSLEPPAAAEQAEVIDFAERSTSGRAPQSVRLVNLRRQ